MNDLLYIIEKSDINKDFLYKTLKKYPEIKFVSMVAVDLMGNDTDEKIPINIMLENIDTFLSEGIQTDGSSVNLPGIAVLNNAKLDMIPDLDCNWFIDYNYENILPDLNKPVGSLKIPCFLKHENNFVDSRYMLKNSIAHFKYELMKLLKNNPHFFESYSFRFEDINKLTLTSATELEFWVRTPNDENSIEALSTSQLLHEQYWKRTKGVVRTALEKTLLLLDKYGFVPEMGHKEVGGVKAKLADTGDLSNIMEQIEIDWRYTDAMQAADNELFIRSLVKETYRKLGLEVTYRAKPLENVAGNGKHIHLGLSVELKDGSLKNIFATNKNNYLSTIGFGAIMGLLKNYEVINPFVSSTNDSLRRLKPGFEAPVCIVTSLGHSVDVPSRNRSVLVGLIRDVFNPNATRFELRSPCPYSNSYLVIAASYLAILDGIKYALTSGKNEDDLNMELSKEPSDYFGYLDENRKYRSEENVFEYYDEKTRNDIFGKSPKTVFENMSSLKTELDKLDILTPIIPDYIISSFYELHIERWHTELTSRIIGKYRDEIRSYKKLHNVDFASDMDFSHWKIINNIRISLMRDSYDQKSLFTRIHESISLKDFSLTSSLQIELDLQMEKLRNAYTLYKKNLLDF